MLTESPLNSSFLRDNVPETIYFHASLRHSTTNNWMWSLTELLLGDTESLKMLTSFSIAQFCLNFLIQFRFKQHCKCTALWWSCSPQSNLHDWMYALCWTALSARPALSLVKPLFGSDCLSAQIIKATVYRVADIKAHLPSLLRSELVD